MVIKKTLLTAGIVFGLFTATTAIADVNKYQGTTLELNTQILNPQAATPRIVPNTVQVHNQTVNQKDLQIEASIQKTQKMSLYHNQPAYELQEMVTYIGQNILRANGINKPISFKYVDDEKINANTNSANVVTVYKGLIKQCTDEDELAYVIGHEIGHASANHILKTSIAKTGSSYAQNMAGNAIRMVTPNKWAALGVDTLSKTAATFGEKKYSRVHEDDADLLSLDYVLNAGYNPLAAISILNKIGSNYVDILSDHPSTDKRIVQAYTYIKQKYPRIVEDGYDSASYDEAIKLYIQHRTNNYTVKRNY